jgi:hypothetical protein
MIRTEVVTEERLTPGGFDAFMIELKALCIKHRVDFGEPEAYLYNGTVNVLLSNTPGELKFVRNGDTP